MKTFVKDHKFNFVDANNVFVGYDSESSCCESFGYIISDTDAIVENTPDLNDDLEPYVFDREYFQEDSWGEENSFVTFRLVAPGLPDLFLTLYNTHNGYYSHGFEFKDANGAIIQHGRL